MTDVVEYLDVKGSSPFAKWHDALDDSVQARIDIAILRLSHENFSTTKGVGAGIFEMRLDFGPGYRIYFGKDGTQLVILLGGGTKKRQATDIEKAISHWKAYKAGKQANDGKDT